MNIKRLVIVIGITVILIGCRRHEVASSPPVLRHSPQQNAMTQELAMRQSHEVIHTLWPTETNIPNAVTVFERTDRWVLSYPPLPWRTTNGKTLPSTRAGADLIRAEICVFKNEARITVEAKR